MTIAQLFRLLLITAACTFFLNGSFAIACEEKFAIPIAFNVSAELASIYGLKQISCQAVAEEPKCAILCISDLELAADERKPVLVALTASAGSKVRAYDLSRFSSLVFADARLVSAGRFLKLSATRASELQQALAAKGTPALVLMNQIASEYIEMPAQ